MKTNRRLALMIDGDNAEASLMPQILAEVSKYGVMTFRRVYGDWTTPNLGSWKQVLHTHALQPEQQFSYTTGKNATDSALIIDAMDMIYTADIDGICIVSSDSDYTRLASRIREKNLFVMGIGRSTTPPAFVRACEIFVYTENLPSVVAVDTQTESPASGITPERTAKTGSKNAAARLKKLIRTAFDLALQDDDGWANLGAMGNSLRQLDPGFDSRTYGHNSLSQLVKAFPDFIELEKRKTSGGGDALYLRLK